MNMNNWILLSITLWLILIFLELVKIDNSIKENFSITLSVGGKTEVLR